MMIAKMISRRIGCKLALIAILGVVTIFLFLAAQGSMFCRFCRYEG